MGPTLQHLLETNIHQQAVTQELAQSLCTATHELLNLKKRPCSGASVPLSHPCREAQHLLTKLCGKDNIEAYI